MRIELSNGNWAELREVAQVTERQRRPVTRALAGVSAAGWRAMELASRQQAEVEKAAKDADYTPTSLTSAEMDELQMSKADIETFGEVNDNGIVALLASWSFPQPITLDSVLDLLSDDYDHLRTVVAPMVSELVLKARPPAPDELPDSPILPSSASAESLRETTPAAPSLMTGEPTNS